MMRNRWTLYAVCIFTIALAGCGNVIAWAPVLVLALSLLLSACIDGELPPESDAGDAASEPDAGTEPDASPDGGTWSPCCQDGVVGSCFCPANAACNYLPYTDCGDGTCFNPFLEDAGACRPTDGGEKDAGPGSWDVCCQDGRIDTCFCPAGWACNYGWFTNCGDGRCVAGAFPADPAVCEPVDPQPGDAGPARGDGGTWSNCCDNGIITSCYCPAGAVCNYFPYTDCGDGTCRERYLPGDTGSCSADAGSGL